MPKLCKAARDSIIERRQCVFDYLKTVPVPVTCADVRDATGIKMHSVRAAIRQLMEGGAVKKCGSAKTHTCNGGTNDTFLYMVTGEEYSEAQAAEEHKAQAKQQNHYLEHPGRIKEIEVTPGHRIVRFGRDYKSDSGQLADNRRTAGSVLNSIY